MLVNSPTVPARSVPPVLGCLPAAAAAGVGAPAPVAATVAPVLAPPLAGLAAGATVGGAAGAIGPQAASSGSVANPATRTSKPRRLTVLRSRATPRAASVSRWSVIDPPLPA